MSGCGCQNELRDRSQRRALIPLLVINGAMFVIELLAGIMGQSTGLIADSLDMLADATVYDMALYAVGRGERDKARAAYVSGMFQVLLATGVMLDVLRRFITGSEPESTLMIGMGLLALSANVTCLFLIARHRHGEIHMRASWLFSRNDVLANLGVMTGGALVMLTGSSLPDLAIGSLIALLIMQGGIRITRDAAHRARD